MISLEDSGERKFAGEFSFRFFRDFSSRGFPGLCLTVQLPPPLSGAEWGNFGRF
uniref:Uncharacterized protein n=1 Tax=Heterorhabditis bacteriophora TaxID=37862 RepID=A0A1I7WXY2_HETBA